MTTTTASKQSVDWYPWGAEIVWELTTNQNPVLRYADFIYNQHDDNYCVKWPDLGIAINDADVSRLCERALEFANAHHRLTGEIPR